MYGEYINKKDEDIIRKMEEMGNSGTTPPGVLILQSILDMRASNLTVKQNFIMICLTVGIYLLTAVMTYIAIVSTIAPKVSG
jgi:hypothetical protein